MKCPFFIFLISKVAERDLEGGFRSLELVQLVVELPIRVDHILVLPRHLNILCIATLA